MKVLNNDYLKLVRGGLEIKQAIYFLSKEEVSLLIKKGCTVLCIGQLENNSDLLCSVFDKDFSPVYGYEMQKYLECE